MPVAPDRLRIAIFTETFLPKIDGVVSILKLMLQRLQEQGHKVILFGPAGGPPEYAGAEIVGVSGPKLFFYPELNLNYPRVWVYERVKQFRPDIIHAVNPMMLGAFGLYCAGKLNTPTLASYHTDLARYADHYGFGFTKPLLWSYLRTMHNRAEVNLCPSSTVRDELRAQGFQRVRWWRRGIDTDFFSPGPVNQAMRARLSNGHPDDFLLINVGRQSPEKGLFGLRDAIFPQEGVRLTLVGGGPAHDDLRTHFAGTPTSFPGYLRGQELIDAYRSADAFIFPSTTETFGLVALEAMACRVPVIAARSGGILDTVRDGYNGLYFDPAYPRQMGDLVRKLRAQPDLRDELAEHALQHARKQSWRATMDQLINYYYMALRVHDYSAPLPMTG
ncbi:MAG: glycosyltransferase family 1 protein [Caldilineaceae bacterium]|nr:glycosyltransferase family 1 protein [Caldilineaceae bacterium]